MVCFAFIFGQLLTFIRYIEVYFTFAFLNCVRYNEDFVKSRFVTSRFCSIHFVVISAWLKKIFRYAEERRYIEPVGKKTGDSSNGTACRQVPIGVTESLSHFAWRSTPKKNTLI